MRKKPVTVTIRELEEVLERYLDAGPGLNYAIKILGHPGVGKSAVVNQVAERRRFMFIDTRLAFKENVDLGGYPVPDHQQRRMIYYRPKFIPPAEVPEGNEGILWFLDEANRAHPTVIQTLFQIITEKTCGEHPLPGRTAIVLAGNLGDADSTTITEFDDSALDGRLAVFHLKPSADEWIRWALANEIHPSIIQYISLFPERLWDEVNINPNPRGWHQVSLAVMQSYGLITEESLRQYIADNPRGTLPLMIQSLVGAAAGSDFITELNAPRLISTDDILSGSEEKLAMVRDEKIPSEDLLWALSGAVSYFRNIMESQKGDLGETDMIRLARTLTFIGHARADIRLSFFYLLMRDCGIFTQVPSVLMKIPDEAMRRKILQRYDQFMKGHDN